KEITSQGKDVATAIIRGLNELGRRRDQVEVTVLQEEKPGFLGIGGKPAIVRSVEKKWDSEHSEPRKRKEESPYAPMGRERKTSGGRRGERGERKSAGGAKRGRPARGEKPARARSAEPREPKENEAQKLPSSEIQNAVVPDNMKEPMAQAKETLKQMLKNMGVCTENLNVWWDGKQQRIILTFDCDHPAVVIGKEGKTLESIQYLITLIISRNFENPISVMADTQNYWRKLEDKINKEIDRAAGMLKRTKRPYRFRPMPAQMRRYIHRFFAEDMDVSTISEGEGKWRKVVLKAQPKTAKTAEAPAADNADCVLTAESAACPIGEADTQAETLAQEAQNQPAPEVKETPESCAVSTLSQEAANTAAPLNSADSEDKSNAISADNAGESCVLTAESAGCNDVADTSAPQPTAEETK
ncbi:MAG: Jag N-terminal domain-containing protein, partial [Elusimicrobiota bacterium]|nr:Jag N-terminal domain-containing protein [Elusimicrobiota bacterium]